MRLEANVRRTRITAICLGIGWALGCGALGCGGDDRRESAPEVSASEVRARTEAALETSAAYLAAERRELERNVGEVLREADAELEEAREVIDDASEASRRGLVDAVERAESARDALRRELDDLRLTGEESWESARNRLSDAMDELAEARREVGQALAGEAPRETG